MTPDDVLRIARQVARRYKRRCWWADLDDLVGEASKAIIVAHKRFDPQVGIPFDGYAQRAASNALQDYLWKQSSPVSGGKHDPRRLIAGVYRAPLEVEVRDASGQAVRRERRELSVWEDPLGQVEAETWRLDVRERVRAIAEQVPNGDLAVRVILHAHRPQDVIRETGRNAHRAVERVRSRIRRDYPMWKLWRGEE